MQRHFQFIQVGLIALFLSTAARAAEDGPDLAPMSLAPEPSYETLDAAPALRASNKYLAFYYSTTNGNWGAGRYADLETAKVLARGYCNSDSCQLIFWTQGACGVLATGSNFGYGWSWNADRATAVQNALVSCSAVTTNCKVLVNECT